MSISKVVDFVIDNNLVAINEMNLPKLPIVQKQWETLSTTTPTYDMTTNNVGSDNYDTASNLVDVPNTSPQTASVNWLLPLVILGGFFAASKFKNKSPKAKKVKL